MKLTPENKVHIDSLSIRELLSDWRFSPSGNPWFEGETGGYWGKRMRELRDQSPEDYVAASKSLG